ncbi:MAG TPA: UDP-glucose 4-epimerase GalE [Cyclobacteriaceae bacterium]|nr:UDP-glucose 4-epimerase GalE [Cyclobacteriaceae bacterium]
MGKVLVTGGIGFIGSHTVVELIQNKFEVVVVDNLSNSQLEVLDGIEKITGVRPLFCNYDLSRKDDVDKLFSEQKNINSIIHFAASKAVGESVQKPLLYYRNNLCSLIYLLEAMTANGVAHIVFSSSCTVYGQPDRLPVTEDTPFKPAESPYGNTKQICEEILRDTCFADKTINAIALRYFNPAGAHESALIGELPRGVPNNLVPVITQAAAGLREEIRVFGTDYNTHDGSAVRDYIHVVDLARAHVVALQRMLNGRQENNYEYFNLGTGKGFSVLDVIQTFERVNNLTLKYRLVARRAGDIEKIYADTSVANNVLGWKTYLDLDEMVRSAWKWQTYLKQHPEWIRS